MTFSYSPCHFCFSLLVPKGIYIYIAVDSASHAALLGTWDTAFCSTNEGPVGDGLLFGFASASKSNNQLDFPGFGPLWLPPVAESLNTERESQHEQTSAMVRGIRKPSH